MTEFTSSLVPELWENILFEHHRDLLSASLDRDRPRSVLRRLTLADFAAYLPFPEKRLRELAHTASGEGAENSFPVGTQDGGRRSYSIADLHRARAHLIASGAAGKLLRSGRRDGEPLLRIVVGNAKGGVCKTSLATGMAHFLCLRGYRTLLVDLDPQGSATTLMRRLIGLDFEPWSTFYGYLLHHKQRLLPDERVQPLDGMPEGPDYFYRHCILRNLDAWPGLHLVPASATLQNAEFDLSSIAGRARSQRIPTSAVFGVLDSAIAEIETDYDVVIVDTPPSMGLLTLNALYNADLLLTPLTMSSVDISAALEWFRSLNAFGGIANNLLAGDGKRGGIDLASILVVATRFDGGTTSKNLLQILQVLLNSKIPQEFAQRYRFLDEVFVNSQAVAAAHSEHQSLYEYVPNGNRRALDRALASLNQVNRRIESVLLHLWGRGDTLWHPSKDPDSRQERAA